MLYMLNLFFATPFCMQFQPVKQLFRWKLGTPALVRVHASVVFSIVRDEQLSELYKTEGG